MNSFGFTRRFAERLHEEHEADGGLWIQRPHIACIRARCVPCCYKLLVKIPPDLACLPNQRPEKCLRVQQRARRVAERAKQRAQEARERKREAEAEGKDVVEESDAEDDGEVDVAAEPQDLDGLYHPSQHILVVGDGNFSFSLALARNLDAMAAASQGEAQTETTGSLTCTSYQSGALVRETYSSTASLLSKLTEQRGVKPIVLHAIDATNLQTHFPDRKFDRILWNFPCVSVPQGKDGQNSEMARNQTLLQQFFASAEKVLAEGGEVHVTHKTKAAYKHWDIRGQAHLHSGLRLRGLVAFDKSVYPAYTNKKVLKGKGSFPIWDSRTFVFGCVPKHQHTDDPPDKPEGAGESHTPTKGTDTDNQSDETEASIQAPETDAPTDKPCTAKTTAEDANTATTANPEPQTKTETARAERWVAPPGSLTRVGQALLEQTLTVLQALKRDQLIQAGQGGRRRRQVGHREEQRDRAAGKRGAKGKRKGKRHKK